MKDKLDKTCRRHMEVRNISRILIELTGIKDNLGDIEIDGKTMLVVWSLKPWAELIWLSLAPSDRQF